MSAPPAGPPTPDPRLPDPPAPQWATVAEAAWAGVAATDPDRTVQLARAVRARWREGLLSTLPPTGWDPPTEAGFPARPVLVDPRELPRRKSSTTAGRLALLHAVAHIEHNAIKLALDAAARFAGLPDEFYDDWLGVAEEEAGHFVLVRDHLRDQGMEYGDLPAHDGLWALCRRTAGDPLARMALVPRVAEARGLDVNPGMQKKLAAAGDRRAVEILEVILRDEIGHVAVGDRWFRWLCEREGCEPESTFRGLLAATGTVVRPPFNHQARLAGGFSASELDALSRS